MHVIVDEEKCCGAGTCVMIAPAVFDQRDEDGIVVLLQSEPDEGQQAAVREAANLCPAAAIRLVAGP
jgi:ferredoxin